MATFSEGALLDKLSKLNETAEMINMTSAWLLYHRKHFAEIAKIWSREIKNIPSSRKLAWIYLANDVVQQSKRRGEEVPFPSLLVDLRANPRRESMHLVQSCQKRWSM